MKELLAKVKKDFTELRTEAIRKEYRLNNREFAAVTLSAVSTKELDHYGVKSIRHKYSGNTVYYLDTGDPYIPTILAYVSFERVTFKIGTWGALVETGNYH